MVDLIRRAFWSIAKVLATGAAEITQPFGTDAYFDGQNVRAQDGDG